MHSSGMTCCTVPYYGTYYVYSVAAKNYCWVTARTDSIMLPLWEGKVMESQKDEKKKKTRRAKREMMGTQSLALAEKHV